MKKSKVLALFLVLALIAMSGIASFAAGESDTAIDDAVNVSTVDGAITVSGTVVNAVSGQQVTVLVVKTALLDTPDKITEDEIAYIDQVPATVGNDGTASFEYSMKLRDGFNAEECTLLMGGTNIDIDGQSQTPLGGSSEGATISGKATPVKSVTDKGKVSVKLYSGEELLQSVNPSEDGTFTFTGVKAGSYKVTISKIGFLTRTFNNVAVAEGGTVSLEDTVLLAGDVDGNGAVQPLDLAALISKLNLRANAKEYDEACDFDANGAIQPLDLTSLIENLNKRAASAYN